MLPDVGYTAKTKRRTMDVVKRVRGSDDTGT